MKRLCFDTESDYYKPPGTGIGTLEEHREFFRSRKIRFDRAVVYDAESRKYRSFTSQQLEQLVAFLATADELVSHSGRLVDLIVLEHACGEGRIAPLRSIPHYDLMEIFNLDSVASLAQKYISAERLSEMERTRGQRLARADQKWPVVNDWSSPENFIARKIAQAQFDVQRTWAVYMAYRKRERSSQAKSRL